MGYCYSRIIKDMLIWLFQNIIFSLRKLRIEDCFVLVGSFLVDPPYEEDFILKPF